MLVMMRVDRPRGETERLVEDAMRAAGIPDRGIGRDDRGRIEGRKTAISATGIVLADIAALPERNDSCYVCIVVGTIRGHRSPPCSDGSHRR
ncbi:hypothetical protein [Halosimplex sp. J119]